jgi:acyl-CoA synthetase (AMP-forming)/AMP-acid ligase II
MGKRWYSVWDPDIPKSFEPEKPLPDYLRDTAMSMPNWIAVNFYGFEMTYQELDDSMDRFAGGLVDLGMKRGDRVAVYMENCPQFVISYFGILRAGGIVVALNPMFKHAELEYEMNDSGAEMLVASDLLYTEVAKIKDRVKLKHIILTSLRDFLPQKPTLPLPSDAEQPKRVFPGTLDFLELLHRSSVKPPRDPINLKEDLALLQYTGGTTGLPKGAMLSHYSLAYAITATVLWFKYTKHDVHLAVTPFFHIMGMLHMCSQFVSGGQVIILARFSPEVVAKAISQYKCTTFMPAPTALIALLSWPNIEAYDLSSLRCLVSGAAPISLETQTKMKRLLPKTVIGEGYGLTETLAQGGLLTPLHRHKAGFVGIPEIGADMKIVDRETGSRELAPNEEGEILIKGPTVMRGYWNKPQETKEVLRDGWLHTGDIGLMDEEGYVRVVGRKKELIKCSGFSVFPSEVEGWLYKHPAVAEAAVIGIPDPYRGEAPKAFIVLKAEYQGKVNESEIMEWSKENMAAYKRPQVVEFLDELPKSAAGKILKRLLK